MCVGDVSGGVAIPAEKEEDAALKVNDAPRTP